MPLTVPLDVGSYTAAEAARLLRTPARNIRRWMRGHRYVAGDAIRQVPPLWQSQLAMFEDSLELGFRDLIELRFVKAFVDAGVGLKAVRGCLEYARECVGDPYPFSTRRFQTDGRTIFLKSIERSTSNEALLDLKTRQYVFKDVIERSFKDLDFDDRTVARWRPFHGKASIVIDPSRAFGQPVAAQFGVPTVALADAVKAEGSVEKAARLFQVPAAVVRDAATFEASLEAA
ncbi:hypothetical protein J1C47_07435 [Jiella sp. MQZ13P-4]|uniref:DUF433 domain-containing protein n=2 Tax=Jiella sonneratiae TaxID=2816856 RepID=A0ABS3J1C9_9HYPH|nr:hypothetical protein [Jiella sonneratiae]